MFFVVYTGDIEEDPKDCGCENFGSLTKAVAFAYRMINKGGYHVMVYEGRKIDL